MLGSYPIDVVLLAPDLEASRDFYRDKLGLEIVAEDDASVTFRCGGDSRIELSRSTIGTADEQTQAAWRVDDLVAELEQLRARGIEIMEYDIPGLKTDGGIVDTGDALHSWIVDPGGNTLAINQPKNPQPRR